MRPNPRSLLFILALAPALAGGVCGPDPGPSACELDRLGCEDPEPSDDFHRDDCPDDVSGALQVEVGSGEEAFASFAPGTGPVVNYGPQGGQHVFMAVRVLNPRFDVSPLLNFSFYLGQGEGCAPPADGVTVIPLCTTMLGSRALMLGSTGFEPHVVDGVVEEFGLVVFVGIPATDVPGIVAVAVEDQCGRRGAAFQAWTVY